MEEKRKKSYWVYAVIRFFVWLFYPKMTVEGAENLPDVPCVMVGNHAQMNGPIACELYSPVRRYTWCAGEMLAWKTVPEYAFRDFWSQKPRYTHWFYKLLSYIITPLSVVIFNNADVIPVYHDARVLTTFRESVRRLAEGASLVIFPEHDAPGKEYLYAFSDRFVDVAKMYYRKSGKALPFVPLYVCPRLRKLCYGKPIWFDPAAPIDRERERICALLTDGILELSHALPRHRVVPYRNIPKRLYPYNIDEEAVK